MPNGENCVVSTVSSTASSSSHDYAGTQIEISLYLLQLVMTVQMQFQRQLARQQLARTAFP
jgi:hypothetical protein